MGINICKLKSIVLHYIHIIKFLTGFNLGVQSPDQILPIQVQYQSQNILGSCTDCGFGCANIYICLLLS